MQTDWAFFSSFLVQIYVKQSERLIVVYFIRCFILLI